MGHDAKSRDGARAPTKSTVPEQYSSKAIHFHVGNSGTNVLWQWLLGSSRDHALWLTDNPTVLVSGGRRGLDLELSPSALVALTSATTASIAKD